MKAAEHMSAEAILSFEPAIRLGAFLGVFVVMALWESLVPQRTRTLPRSFRWLNNLGLLVVGNLALRAALPLLAVGTAVIAHDKGWGLFNVLETPLWASTAASVILLDLAIYFQHVVFHKVPALWVLHRVHHSDTNLDVSTALRFHPFEIILSLIVKMAIIMLLGAPPLGVLIFEILLNATAMFNHANVKLPRPVDAILRGIIVTPDMHAVHHSIEQRESNSNFGFNLSVWDRLFGTYLEAPANGNAGLIIGLRVFRSARDNRLDRLLLQPFRRQPEQAENSAPTTPPIA